MKSATVFSIATAVGLSIFSVIAGFAHHDRAIGEVHIDDAQALGGLAAAPAAGRVTVGDTPDAPGPGASPARTN